MPASYIIHDITVGPETSSPATLSPFVLIRGGCLTWPQTSYFVSCSRKSFSMRCAAHLSRRFATFSLILFISSIVLVRRRRVCLVCRGILCSIRGCKSRGRLRLRLRARLVACSCGSACSLQTLTWVVCVKKVTERKRKGSRVFTPGCLRLRRFRLGRISRFFRWCRLRDRGCRLLPFVVRTLLCRLVRWGRCRRRRFRWGGSLRF